MAIEQLKKKILPVKYPTVTSWPSHATLFTILETRNETLDWIYGTHIQTCAVKYSFTKYSNNNRAFFIYDYLPNTMNYLMCPWLYPQIINSEFITMKYQDINDFIITAIDADSYVYIVINEEYILDELIGTQSTGFHHHGLLIYGYNLDTRKYYVADFLRNLKYSFEEVSMENVSKGYAEIPDGEEYSKGGTILLKFNEIAKYKFDTGLVKNGLQDYLDSRSSSIGFENLYRLSATDNSIASDTMNMGISAYHLLYEHFQLIEKNESDIDLSAIHAVYDHKKLMHMRVKFMLDNGYLETNESVLNDLLIIEEQALKLRNLYQKYLVSKESSIIKRIISGYKQIEEQEQHLLPKLVCGIRC